MLPIARVEPSDFHATSVCLERITGIGDVPEGLILSIRTSKFCDGWLGELGSDSSTIPSPPQLAGK